jgi:PAS domain S-box-containing protein
MKQRTVWLRNSWRLTVSVLAIGLVTLLGYEFHLNPPTVVPVYVLIIGLHALFGGFVSSAIVSVLAAACLSYFFSHPLFSFHVGDPLNVVELLEFLIVGQLVVVLVSRAHQALRQSEERFRLATEATNDAIWDVDLKAGRVSWNETYSKLYGRPSTTSDSWQWWIDRIHAEDRERTVDGLRESVRSGASTWTCEYRFRRANGEWAYIYDRAYIARDSSGKAWRVIGAMQDLTDRKQAEAAVRQSEERLRASEIQLKDAQRLVKVSSWERNVATGISQWSDENRRILGLPTDAPATFATFLRCVHPNDLDRVLEAEQNVRTSPGPIEVEFRLLRSNGEVRFVRAILEALKDDQGVATRIVGATQDITDQIKARELLLESEQRLRSAERLAHVGHWSRDLKRNQLIWSEECFRIFGRPPDYIPSYEGFLNAVLPQDRALVEQTAIRRLEEKRGTSIDYRIIRPNGEVRTLKSMSEVVLDEEGTPVRMFGALQDITDLKRAQEESLARQKLESLGTVASGIAHDFNNLLGAVLAQAELAQAECAAGSFPEEELRGIRNVAIRGSEIVRQLMTFAGTDSESAGLVDVSQIVDEMIELLKISVSKHATIQTDLDRGLRPVQGNAAQLRQVVLNLVRNASEAIGNQDGAINVTTSSITTARRVFGGTWDRLAEGDYVQLMVSDTGCGISEETRTRIFDPFFTTKTAGHGLGLSVVDGIVRSLGGAIYFTSEPGKGTVFQVALPCADIAAASNTAPIRSIGEPSRSFQELTLMIVEDEDPLRHALAKMLRKTGFNILEAANGSVAIDLLRTKGRQLDLILLDATIPGSSSEEIVATSAQAWPHVKIILTSAYSADVIAGTRNSSRIHSFIRKPFQFVDLLQTLRNATATGQSASVH